MKTKVILADDHKILREGLKTLLMQQNDVEVVGEAGDGFETIRLCNALQPDLVIMDIGMPSLNGIEACKRILSENPKIKVLALSMHSDKQFVINMFKAGASGYLLKDCAADELKVAIQTILGNNFFLSQHISKIVIMELINSRDVSQNKDIPQLSGREKEVLQMIAEGMSTKEIGKKLFISPKTVESHRKNIMQKLELYTLPELTKYAIRAGITFLEK